MTPRRPYPADRVHAADYPCPRCVAYRRGLATRTPSLATRTPSLATRTRLLWFVAGLVAGQLALFLVDPLIGGPGPFAWIGMFK